METWKLEDPTTDPKEIAIIKYLKETTGNEELANNAGRMVGLYNFLERNRFSSPDEIHNAVFVGSEPMFTLEQSEKIYGMLSDSKFVGGAGETPTGLPTQQQEHVELLDNLIIRLVYFVRGWTPKFILDNVDSVTPFLFILRTFEHNEVVGPLLGVALDAVTSILPTIASTIQNLSPTIIGLLPLPEAGPVGALIGWAVSSLFTFLAMALHISRGHFGQAFIVSFLMIPFAGASLYSAAMSGERVLTRTADRRARLITTVTRLLGEGAGQIANSVIPDVLYDPSQNQETLSQTPPPPPTVPPPSTQSWLEKMKDAYITPAFGKTASLQTATPPTQQGVEANGPSITAVLTSARDLNPVLVDKILSNTKFITLFNATVDLDELSLPEFRDKYNQFYSTFVGSGETNLLNGISQVQSLLTSKYCSFKVNDPVDYTDAAGRPASGTIYSIEGFDSKTNTCNSVKIHRNVSAERGDQIDSVPTSDIKQSQTIQDKKTILKSVLNSIGTNLNKSISTLSTVKQNDSDVNNQGKIQKVIDSLSRISKALQGEQVNTSFFRNPFKKTGGKTLSKKKRNTHKWTKRRKLRK
jgi:hypothetical protein